MTTIFDRMLQCVECFQFTILKVITMTRFIRLSLLGCLTCITLSACSETSTVTSDKKIKTPGGETDVKTTQEIKKTGDHKTDER